MLVPNQGKPRLWPGLRLELALVFTRQGLAVVAGDRAGAGAALGFNQAKPWPPIQPGKPWPPIQPGKALAVGPVIELAQVQMLVLNQASPRL